MPDPVSSTQPFTDFFEASPKGASLNALREQSFAAYRDLGLPNKRREEWKYTDLTFIGKKSFSKPAPFEGGIDGSSAFSDIDAYTFVFVNGFYRPDLSKTADLPQGVEAVSLASVTELPNWAEELLSADQQPAEHSVLALNTALMRDGVLLRVAPGVQVGKPIYLRFVTSGTGHDDSPSSFLRNIVHVGEGAAATILESHESTLIEDYFASVATQFYVADDAQLAHVKLQKEGLQANHLATQLLSVGANASFRGFYSNGGAGLCRNEIHGTFRGEGGYIQLDGIFLGTGTQHCDNTTFIDHAVPSCESSQVFKGVLDEKSRGVYQGQVTVAKDAQHTDGRQLVKTLLLSDEAEIDAKPELKIFADDVKCAHGATTGDIDEEQLFYLCSRGIDEVTARALLVEAFLTEVLERIDDEPIRDACRQEVVGWLDTHGKGRRHVG